MISQIFLDHGQKRGKYQDVERKRGVYDYRSSTVRNRFGELQFQRRSAIFNLYLYVSYYEHLYVSINSDLQI